MGSRFDWVADTDYNDIAILLGYALGTFGYLFGLGILNHPIARIFGRSGSTSPRAAPAGAGICAPAPTTR